MATEVLPFQPIRSTLYTSAELAFGFDASNPSSIGRMADFQTFQYFVRHGRAAALDPYASMMEALHDNSILRAMFAFLSGRKRVAAVMGGHREERGSAAYRSVVTLAKRLSESGFLMASGGGPGAMEATHLGSLMMGRSAEEVDQAIASLASQPKLPEGADKIVDKDGRISDERLLHCLHEWSAPAHMLLAQVGSGGESLAVPTWHYGHEPVTPLASHAAKYFLNSIREDVLLLLAAQGIIFAPGRAGTLQEVFQDAAQNYYPGPDGAFSPMVFFDVDGFWTKKLPVGDLLQNLFALGGSDKANAYRENVLFTDSIDTIVEFLEQKTSTGVLFTSRLESLGMHQMVQVSD